MYTSTEQGLNAYKAELAQYKKFLDGLRAKYGNDIDPLKLDDPYYRQALEWNARLQGMIRALGLTKAEEHAIDIEFGIVAD